MSEIPLIFSHLTYYFAGWPWHYLLIRCRAALIGVQELHIVHTVQRAVVTRKWDVGFPLGFRPFPKYFGVLFGDSVSNLPCSSRKAPSHLWIQTGLGLPSRRTIVRTPKWSMPAKSGGIRVRNRLNGGCYDMIMIWAGPLDFFTAAICLMLTRFRPWHINSWASIVTHNLARKTPQLDTHRHYIHTVIQPGNTVDRWHLTKKKKQAAAAARMRQ